MLALKEKKIDTHCKTEKEKKVQENKMKQE